MNEAILKAEALEAGYGEVQVLWGISLGAQDGGLTTIVGANGVGKTTALRAIVGSIRPWAGKVLFKGEDVTRLPPHLKAALGMALVPEGRQLFNDMSVQENLEMGAFARRGSRSYGSRLERAYALFPVLKKRRLQRAGTLSGGEQQMLAIARGIMSEPDLLIIDELSLGLAPLVVHQIFATLKTLKEEGLTILLVEQNVHLAFAMSDYAYVMAEGRLFTEGVPEKLEAMPEIRKAYLGL
jgi:branched-chain amino acid transport system ATP-binding protein